jgi:hypothetical protein
MMRIASLVVGTAAIFSSAAHADSATIVDNASSATAAIITMPSYTMKPLGKWTVVVTNGSISFRSIDGAQTLVPVVAQLHPKPKETEAILFDRFVEQRNADGAGPACAPPDAASPAKAPDAHFASWCSFDASKSHGSLLAVLVQKRKVLNVSFDADAVSEEEFRRRAAAIVSSMALK